MAMQLPMQRGCSSLIWHPRVRVSVGRLHADRNNRNNATDIIPFPAARRRHSHAAGVGHVAAVVIGAGPAGIATVGNLLERLPKEAGQIVWIDNSRFMGGAIRLFPQVPSNTTVKLFLEFARAVEPFREIRRAWPSAPAMAALERRPENDTCSLYKAGKMLEFLARGLRGNDRVTSIKGKVLDITWDEGAERWHVGFSGQGSSSLTTDMVVRCTGSVPRRMSLPGVHRNNKGIINVKLQTALDTEALVRLIQKDPQARTPHFGVIGSSHSAILILRNLHKLVDRDYSNLRVTWFTRNPKLTYAVPMGDWIRYDNTGLKGLAADYAREQLDADVLETSAAGRFIRRVDLSGLPYRQLTAIVDTIHNTKISHMVQAIGFERYEIGQPDPEDLPVPNPVTGALEFTPGDASKTAPYGQYGAGIAYPERVEYPDGSVEYAVGFWKFMNFLQRVVPQWVEETHGTKAQAQKLRARADNAMVESSKAN